MFGRKAGDAIADAGTHVTNELSTIVQKAITLIVAAVGLALLAFVMAGTALVCVAASTR